MLTTIIGPEDIKKIVERLGLDSIMVNLIDRLANALGAYDSRFETPVRSGFHYHVPHLGLIEWMPLMDRGNQATIKVVGYHPENPNAHRLPTILSTISTYDTSNGHLSGLMDGTLVTALRTGAASAVASQRLAYPESSTLGLIGCGCQAVTQLHALLQCFPIRRVVYYDCDDTATDSFQLRCQCFLNGADVEFQRAEIAQIVSESDILCTATSIDVNQGPVFQEFDCKPHLHVNAVGSDFPGKFELPVAMLRQSFVCPDFLEQALKEGECQQLAKDEIGDTLVSVVQRSGNYESMRNRTTVFDSTGWSFEDFVVSNMFHQIAEELELGTKVEIESRSIDPKDPYAFLGINAAHLVSDA